jgi:penicillin-insensitive murein DD-endopeptidase
MKAFVAIALCAAVSARAEPSSPVVWGAVERPTSGPAEAIGGYSAGCVAGAAALPQKGSGFRITRPERHRWFGHPLLIAFIETLATQLHARHLPLLAVGDLGQPRGGPAPTGHASHQSGLDVDLAYAPPATGNAPPSMVDGKKPARAFSPKVARILQLAAGDARVDRIFVNPILKRALCESAGDRAWLHKLRPWWGHADHFHVRLACPADNAGCTAQPALPDGDGCSELGWWFSPKADGDRQQAKDAYKSKVGAGPDLPERCKEILGAE